MIWGAGKGSVRRRDQMLLEGLAPAAGGTP
jgi:hypothetical protein